MRIFIVLFVIIIGSLIAIKVIQNDYDLSKLLITDLEKGNFSSHGNIFSIIMTKTNSNERLITSSTIDNEEDKEHPEKTIQETNNGILGLLMNLIVEKAEEAKPKSYPETINQITRLLDNITGTDTEKSVILYGNWSMEIVDYKLNHLYINISIIDSGGSIQNYHLSKMNINSISKLDSNSNYLINGDVQIKKTDDFDKDKIVTSDILIIIYKNFINIILDQGSLGKSYNGQPIYGFITS